MSKLVIQFFIRHCCKCNSWIVYSDESIVWDLNSARYHHLDWSLVRPRDGGLHVSMLGQVLKESKHLIISRFGGFLLVFCDMWGFPSAELKWIAACKTFLIYGMEFFFSTIFKDKDSNYQEIVLSWTALSCWVRQPHHRKDWLKNKLLNREQVMANQFQERKRRIK